MGIFFSSSKSKRTTAHDRAELDLKVQRDKLKQYQVKINVVIEKENQAARDLLKLGKKKQALLVLKKKKYQEQLLEKSEQQLANIQEMVDSIEFARMEKRVFDGLKAGNEVLTAIHKEMSIEAVENLMADTQDALEYQNEIDNLLSSGLSKQEEEDILAEVDELEKELLILPSVPASIPAVDKPLVATPAASVSLDDIQVEEEVKPSKKVALEV